MFQAHRRDFLEHMADGDVALFQGAGLAVRNHDVEFPFRQQSSFWYLTGCPEADAALMLAKGIDDCATETLFVLPRDPARETWVGRRLGPEGAMEQLGFEAAFDNGEFREKAAAALAKAKRVWCQLGFNAELDAFLMETIADLRAKGRLGLAPPEQLIDAGTVLHEMRVIKSEPELKLMRKAAAVSAEAHMLAMAQCKPGMPEYELEALLHYTFRRHGCNDAGWAYPSIVAGGDNANILHYNTNHMELRGGDLVLIDAGAEYGCYAADITRTFPVDGVFSPAQRDIYEVVLAAQVAAVDAVRVGNEFHYAHEVSLTRLCEGLKQLGVLQCSVEEAMETDAHKQWTIHNTSHYIGLDVHDCGVSKADGKSRPLQAGMVLTIEPGLYFPADDETVPAALRGIGIRIEDDVHVTGGDPENLTAATPKSLADVEEACAAERVAPPTLETARTIR
jgi:Xaa-Pro aminopeptidase